MSKREFLRVDSEPAPTAETLAFRLLLNFRAGVFVRMKQLGIKQKDLAERLGVSTAAVSKMLSSKSNLTLASMARVAIALDCTIGTIRLQPLSVATYPKATASSSEAAPQRAVPLFDGRKDFLVSYNQPAEMGEGKSARQAPAGAGSFERPIIASASASPTERQKAVRLRDSNLGVAA